MSGNRSRDKGYRGESAIVKIFQRAGFKAKRVPLSGAVEGFPGDIQVECLDLPCEVKNRESNPKRFWEWLEGNGALFLKRNHYPWLVVMELDPFLKLIHSQSSKRDQDVDKKPGRFLDGYAWL